MRKILKSAAAGLLGLLIAMPGVHSELPFGPQYTRYQEPDFLTYKELVALTADPHPGGALEAKLEKFWRTPIISNEAYYRGVKPHHPTHPKLGDGLTFASWNIEKSINTERVTKLFKSPTSLYAIINHDKVAQNSSTYQTMVRQLKRLLQADVLLLQEMDIGVKRSDYVNAAAEIAKSLDMNYAYGAEQLEIDPVILGTEKVIYRDGTPDEESSAFFAVDAKKYKGVFGSAVLSRYPIKNVEVFQLNNQAYDWFWGEKPKNTFVEKSRRQGTKLLFKNIITRELKVGGRIYMRVDLDVPGLPGNTLTVINIHLEIKCQPKGREKQIQEILGYIKDIKNPVIVAGDFNAAPNDLSSTSITRIVSRTAKDPTTWFSVAVTYLSPYALAINTTRGLSNVTKNLQDPFAKNIPVIAPNAVKGMFQAIENFRFSDGTSFDFRGDPEKSINGKSGKLANSNERDLKGFKTSFQVRRPIGPIIGKLRLDWIFVRSGFLRDPEDPAGVYRFAPHFGETLEEFNTNIFPPLSDHHPNVIDLPFEEPSKKKV